MASEKIGTDYQVNIQVEYKEGGTIQFTITADSRTRADNALQHIQGEFCDVSICIIIFTGRMYIMCPWYRVTCTIWF